MDVRMLGEGRPFILQMDECMKIRLPDVKVLENEMKASAEPVVLVRDLQMVDKYASGLLDLTRTDLQIRIISRKERRKRRNITGTQMILRKLTTSRALVEVPAEIDEKAIERLNNTSIPFTIQQGTPIRVLHRYRQLLRSG